MAKSNTQQLLENALLNDGAMQQDLYEFELEKLVDDMKLSMQQDKDHYLFAVTHNKGYVAMVLIESPDSVYINEAAREKLKTAWKLNYSKNLKKIIPHMAKELDNGEITFTGVKTI
jgi:hypothetical protein